MNKKTIIYLICLSFTPMAPCAVSFRLADPNTLMPLSTQEIVLGSPVALVIHSDANEPWKGGLFLREENRSLSMLAGRGENPRLRHYPSSCLADAGEHARAMLWKDSFLYGFDFYSDDVSPRPGDWFVVDYLPLEPGLCQIGFYEYTDPNKWNQPHSLLLLENTPSRDFNGNGVVNLEDFMRFASFWLAADCGDPYWCQQTDLDRDGSVGLTDLLMFSDHWLWGTPGWKPSEGPADPNVIYSITDSEGADEIELPVGESITLYIHKTTLEKAVFLFHLEAVISDASLGWIDNTEYDPNNPSGSGTAQILVSPRMTFFDYWGPGSTQAEGIQFFAVNVGSPLNDGALASFVYTAAAAGEVTLALIDYGSLPSSLHGLRIHQSDGMQSMGQSMTLQTEGFSESLQTEQTEINPDYTLEEMIDFLETIWEEDPELRQTISEDEWNEFMEKVKESEATDVD